MTDSRCFRHKTLKRRGFVALLALPVGIITGAVAGAT